MVITKWVFAGLVVIALLVGMVGMTMVNLYVRHGEQHRVAEQFMKDQQTLNQQLITAMNQLLKK